MVLRENGRHWVTVPEALCLYADTEESWCPVSQSVALLFSLLSPQFVSPKGTRTDYGRAG